MTLITRTDDLARHCSAWAGAPYITIDTEFIRESTYWPRLCLVQIAGPEDGSGGDEAAIDPLADGIDLQPLFDLMANPSVLKGFHAARQDLESFVKLTGFVPAPIFDTQVVAMVCGNGDQVGYETQVNKIAKASIDKSARFTDWAKRPLTDRQLSYAMADVTHLRKIYDVLSAELERAGRAEWVEEEMEILASVETYQVDPREAWRRIKSRGAKPRVLAILRELAAWRETEAQRRDMPRNRLIRDEALLELAASGPRTVEDLARTRGLSKGQAEGRMGQDRLAAVETARALNESDWPAFERRPDILPGIGPLSDLLKVLLKLRCEENAVAQKLVANASDLDVIASTEEPDIPAMKGWRRKVFGEDALALKSGHLGLAASGTAIHVLRIEDGVMTPEDNHKKQRTKKKPKRRRPNGSSTPDEPGSAG